MHSIKKKINKKKKIDSITFSWCEPVKPIESKNDFSKSLKKQQNEKVKRVTLSDLSL